MATLPHCQIAPIIRAFHKERDRPAAVISPQTKVNLLQTLGELIEILKRIRHNSKESEKENERPKRTPLEAQITLHSPKPQFHVVSN